MLKKKDLAVVILAAGKGTRMRSELPKALHTLCGEPMLGLLLKNAQSLKPRKIIVVAGHRFDLVQKYLNVGAGAAPATAGRHASPLLVHQQPLLGSGHAVMQAAKALSGFKGRILVLYCDTPLISSRTMGLLLDQNGETAAVCTLLSVEFQDPFGYGRIQRALDGSVERIIEQNDATEVEKAIKEINAGCYVFDSKELFEALKLVQKKPKKKEYYLTDAVGILAKNGKRVEALPLKNKEEVLGINTRKDLAALQEILQKKILDGWIEKGIKIRDPRTTTIDAGVEIGAETLILPHTVIEDGSRIGTGCVIGPFARIRGNSVIGDGSIIGNFVEVVRSRIGKHTQVKHLSYLGDAQVGSFVNIGAGTITANFDGKRKYKTVIKDKAQIGSGTVLVAPVTVGKGAKTGAGAVVTRGKNVPAGAVVVGVPARPLEQKRYKSLKSYKG